MSQSRKLDNLSVLHLGHTGGEGVSVHRGTSCSLLQRPLETEASPQRDSEIFTLFFWLMFRAKTDT